MFQLADPILTPTRYSVAGYRVLMPPPNNYAPLAVAIEQLPSAVTIDPAVTISGSIATTPVPVDTNPRVLVIDGLTYHFSLLNPPPIGSFAIADGNLIIGLYSSKPIRAISYNSIFPSIPTDQVNDPYPDLLTRFPLKGELSWTLTLEEQPTAQLNFITLASERDNVIRYFSGHRQIVIYGVGFAPSGQLSITDVAKSRSAIALIEVSLSLTGYHAKALEAYTTLRQKITTIFASIPATTTYSDITSATVQDLARQVGTQIQGELININASTVSDTTSVTTLAERLTNADIRSIGCFVDYNSPIAIKLQRYHNVLTHLVYESDIRSDIQTSFSNRLNIGATECGYYKTYDPGTEISFGSGAVTTPKTTLPKTRWQPKQPELTESIEGDPTASTSPYPVFVNDLSAVFDISGKRKRLKKTKLKNGQPISSQQEEWGYVAVARDNAIISVGSTVINGVWRKISDSTTVYTYNNYGYLVESITTGTLLVRHQVENPQKPETLNFVVTGPIVESTFDPYRFKLVPSKTIETYELEPFSKYYSDIKPATITRTAYLADGKTETEIAEIDKSWIPPYFVALKTVVETATSIIPNPKSTIDKPLPLLTAGKSTINIERITIADRIGGKDPITYLRVVDNQSAQGAQLGSNVSNAETSTNSGRPPLAANLGASLEIAKPPEPKEFIDPNPQPLIIKSNISGDTIGIEGVNTLNFPIATSQSQAVAAAQVDIDITNAKNTIQSRFIIDFRPHLMPGDKLIYQANQISKQRRIISVSQKLRIDGITSDRQPLITSEGTSIQVGVDYPTPIVVVQSSQSSIIGTAPLQN